MTVLLFALSILTGLVAAVPLWLLPKSAAFPVGARLMLAMFIGQLTIVAGVLIVARWKGDSLVSALALRAPKGGFWAYAGALAVTMAAVAAYSIVTVLITGRDSTADMGEMVGIIRGPAWPFALAVIGIGAPLSEELLFRGFLQTALAQSRLGFWGAAAVTTTVWTSLHAGYSLLGLGQVFLIGLIFAIFLRYLGSLRVTLTCHAIYNTLVGLVVIFGT